MDNNDIISIIFDFLIGDKKYWKTKYRESIKYINYLSKSYIKDCNDCKSFIRFVWDVIFVDLYFIGIFPPKKVKKIIFIKKICLY